MRQPVLQVRDGFGKLVKRSDLTIRLDVRVVHAAYNGEGTMSFSAEHDRSADAQLVGGTTIRTSHSDPLARDAWNTTIFTGQHGVFDDLAIGTSGSWRLHVSSPSLQAPAISGVVQVEPGEPVILRIDRPEAPLRTPVMQPLSPAIVVRMFDASGNNITHENATARIELVLVPADGEASAG